MIFTDLESVRKHVQTCARPCAPVAAQAWAAVHTVMACVVTAMCARGRAGMGGLAEHAGWRVYDHVYRHGCRKVLTCV